MIGDFWLLIEGLKVEVWAVFIAVLALGLTIWQGYLSRKHNRISVRPVLRLVTEYSLGNDDHKYAISVKNCGLGSAIIKDVQIFIKDAEVGKAYSDESWNRAIELAKSEHSVFDDFYYTIFTKDVTINSGESVEILWHESDVEKPIIDKVLEEFVFKVSYQSFYKEKFEL